MRRLLPLLGLLSLGFAPTPFPRPKKPDPSKEHLQKMQGEWELIRLVIAGRDRSERGKGTTIVIAADRMKQFVRGKLTHEWVVTRDADKKPMVLDRKQLPGETTGINYRGIFRLDGNTLVLCFCHGKRPNDFGCAAFGVYLEVFQRRKR